MAYNKEALAIVLDVGPSMNQAPPGEDTALQAAIGAINMILQRKMFAESKDEIALILCGSENTANDLCDGSSYEHISVVRPLAMVDWDLLQYLQNDVKPTNTNADFLDAIVVAMDHLVKGIEGKRGFASKRVLLLSDMGGEFGDDQLDDIIASMKEQAVEFNIIGPVIDDDDDDDEGGPSSGASKDVNGHTKARTPQQRAGEMLLRHIIEAVDGACYSFDEAIQALSYFQSRQVRPTAWKCPLEIGPDLQIPVNGYIKVKEAKPKSYKNVYARDPDGEIQRLRTFHLNDEEETEIEQSDTVEGHRYGSTLVPFSEDDKDAMKFRAQKCFKILGFTKSECVKRHHFMGDYCMAVTAEKGDESAGIALSALIQAMYEANMVAIVRRVYSNASSVKMGVLTPHIKAKYECLYYNELPFSEDLRQFTFGSLPVSADNEAAGDKFKPSGEQLAAVDKLIDNMDLSQAERDSDDEADEALKPKLTFNPHLQRLYQCLQHRSLNPDEPLPELSPLVARYLEPPQEVMTKCKPALDKVSKVFKLEDVSKKKAQETGENMFKDAANAKDGPDAKKQKLDDDLKGGMADLVKGKVTEVGTVTPIEDFKAIIGQKDEKRFDQGFDMMQKRVVQIIMDSFGAQFYGKAMDCLKALRVESVKSQQAKKFNDFLKELKSSLSSKGRMDFWKQIVSEKVTLVSKVECEVGGVSREDAEQFIAEVAAKKEEPAPAADDDEDDLLDQME